MVEEMNNEEEEEVKGYRDFYTIPEKKEKSFNRKVCFWTKGIIVLLMIFIGVLGFSISVNFNSF
jgi:hypothetical protein